MSKVYKIKCVKEDKQIYLLGAPVLGDEDDQLPIIDLLEFNTEAETMGTFLEIVESESRVLFISAY
jgi:hypothetical protein